MTSRIEDERLELFYPERECRFEITITIILENRSCVSKAKFNAQKNYARSHDFIFSIQSKAQESKEIVGSDITSGDWGNISISSNKESTISYEISTTGGNGSTCEMSGQMQYDKSKSYFSGEGHGTEVFG